MGKIISNYNILKSEDGSSESKEPQSIDPIIKIPVYEKEETRINVNTNTSDARMTEPKLQLTRNNEGVVVGIEVQCTCGEKILIKMDYKV